MSRFRFGLLSTAKINLEILAGAAESDTVQIVAVGSRDQAKADAYAAEHGLARAHGSYEALLADPEVDAVYISLPNGLHHPWTLTAIAAGKHVLVEKPYTRRPADVIAAWDAADAAGVTVMEAFMYRHHPQTLRVKELVDEGAIGRLLAVKSTFTFPLDDLSDVRAQPALDGGALMDVGCYTVSGTRLIAGEPISVLAEQVTGTTGIDMALHGTMRHADDVVSQFEATFLAPRRQDLEVVGTEGVLGVTAPWRADWGGALTITRPDDSVEAIVVESMNPYRLELEDLAAAATEGRPALLGRDDALGQARTIEALYRSAAEGRRVEL
jgi:D-xylose 1-dehydrogenase (NADP+, D-xylono-1,5-lactone-forming)